MADAISVSGPISGTDRTLTFEPESWPNWPTAPFLHVSATPFCWLRPPQHVQFGRGPISSPHR